MSEQRRAFSSPAPAAAVALSPRQFHAAVKSLLREAMAEAGGDGEEALRRLTALLRETPSLGGTPRHPPFVPGCIANGVRVIVAWRRDDAAAGSERLLADLLEFVLAFYPEAIPPPCWNGSAGGFGPRHGHLG